MTVEMRELIHDMLENLIGRVTWQKLCSRTALINAVTTATGRVLPDGQWFDGT